MKAISDEPPSSLTSRLRWRARPCSMEADLHTLRARIVCLEARERRRAVCLAGLGACLLIGATAQASADDQPVDRIVAREIVVVDPSGRERIVLGSPLPEPRLAGVRSKRGELVSGILLFDGEGNERGGYVTGDAPSSGVALTLDEIGRMSVGLWAGERGSSGLRIGNQDGNSVELAVNPAGSFVAVRERGEITASMPSIPPAAETEAGQ